MTNSVKNTTTGIGNGDIIARCWEEGEGGKARGQTPDCVRSWGTERSPCPRPKLITFVVLQRENEKGKGNRGGKDRNSSDKRKRKKQTNPQNREDVKLYCEGGGKWGGKALEERKRVPG